MNSKNISKDIFLAGFLLGVFISYIKVIRKYLLIFSNIFYAGVVDFKIFALFWGITLGVIFFLFYRLLRERGWLGVIKVALLITLCISAFTIALSGLL